jgi:hypothetical protein
MRCSGSGSGSTKMARGRAAIGIGVRAYELGSPIPLTPRCAHADADEEADSDSVTGSNTGERLTFASERNGGNEVHAKRSNSYDDSIVGKLSNENEEVEEEHGLEGNTREEHAYLNGNDLQTGAHSLESALSNILDKSSMKEPLEEEEAHLSENDSFGGPQVERPLLRSSSSISSTSSGFLSYSSPHRTSANASNNDPMKPFKTSPTNKVAQDMNMT